MMTRCLTGMLAMLTAAVVPQVNAVTFVPWNGTEPWPTSGNVSFNQNVKVEVDDAHVDAVAGWDNVYLSSGTQLKFVNSTKAAVLKANVEGSGTIAALDSIGLTISGDNGKSNRTGGCDFKNSTVVVANEYGLGGTASKSAVVTFTAAGALGSLTFRLPAWDEQDWTGVKAITNHCPIEYVGEASVGKAKMIIGSAAKDEYFVQDADFILPPGSATDYPRFRNNYEQISGVFGIKDQRNSYSSYTYTEAGAVIRFSGTTALRFDDTAHNNNGWVAEGQYGDYYFGHSGGFHGEKFMPNMGRIHIERDGVFDDFQTSTAPKPGVSLSPYIRDNITQTNRIDLNGHDITLASMKSASGQTTQNETKYFDIVTDEPATITLAGNFVGSTYTIGAKCEGPVSIVFDNGATNALATCISTSRGTLTVKRGSTLNLKWYAAWTGRIVVEDGGVLLWDQNPLNILSGDLENMFPDLDIEPGGSLVTSVGVYTRLLHVNGVKIPQHSTNLAEFQRNFGIPESVFGGKGTAVVNISYKLPFAGWPQDGEEGKAVEIPAKSNIVVTAADAEAFARAGEVGLGYDSSLTIANDSGIVTFNGSFSSWASNFGKISITDSAGVVLAGDNSNLYNGNAIKIKNSEVLVTHPRGLGGPASAPAEFEYGTGGRQLRFRNPAWDDPSFAGVKVFTNEAPVLLTSAGDYETAPIAFGSEAANEFLVQAGDFTNGGTGGYGYACRFRGNVEFLGQFAVLGGASCNMRNDEDAVVKFGPSCTFSGKVQKDNPDGKLTVSAYCPDRPHMGEIVFASTDASKLCNILFSKTALRLDGDNAWGPADSAATINYFQNTDPLKMTQVDLNGHDVITSGMKPQYLGYDDLWTAGPSIVTSSVPATLTVVGSADYPIQSMRFVDAAGFRYAGTMTNVFCKHVSTSTNGFRVSSGVAGFDHGATWAGSVTADGTGTLYIGAGSPYAFGTADDDLETRSTALLNVDGDGRLQLEAEMTVVKYLKRNGAFQHRGRYTAATCGWIAGPGTLRVLKSSDEPQGAMIFVR